MWVYRRRARWHWSYRSGPGAWVESGFTRIRLQIVIVWVCSRQCGNRKGVEYDEGKEIHFAVAIASLPCKQADEVLVNGSLNEAEHLT